MEQAKLSADFNGRVVTIFGGAGFVGRYVAMQLAAAGAVVRIVTRQPERVNLLKSGGAAGQIVPVVGAYQSQTDIETLVAGSFAVVNCLGTLYDKPGLGSFTHVHSEVPVWIARACARQGVERFVHISALGVDASRSLYAQSKYAGEGKVRAAFPQATIMRPSVIFGPEDNFFNMFARLSRFLPVLPLVGGGKTRFQPVYVQDVARAIVQALCDVRFCGQVYELGGPEVVTFREIYQRLFAYTGMKRYLLPLPWGIARMQAALMSILPAPPLTNDQITSLQTDNVVTEGALGLVDLGISPTLMETVVPDYLRYTFGRRK